MGKTSIEWATHTHNWLAGCTKVSPACKHCYAETMTARLAAMPNAPARYRDGVVADRRWTGRVSYDREALLDLFATMRSWQPRGGVRRVFCNSMSDTFEEDAPPESLVELAAEIRRFQAFREDCGDTAVWRVLMLLTKRPERMLAWQREHFPEGLPRWVWCGTTVEDQERADERVPTLLRVRCAVRFLSMEPMLGPVDLEPWLAPERTCEGCDTGCDACPMHRAVVLDEDFDEATGAQPIRVVHWVIVGGESGDHARPMHPQWVRDVRDQCVAAGVPFFFKQWGEWRPISEGGGDWYDHLYTSVRKARDGESQADLDDVYGRKCTVAELILRTDGDHRRIGDAGAFNSDLPGWPAMQAFRVGKHAAGRTLEGRTWDEVPA